MRGPENKSHEYQPQESITLGVFDLTPVKEDTLIRLAHLRLVYHPRDMIAKKLIAEHDNKHPLKDNLVAILLERMGVSQFYADLSVKDGQLQRVCRIVLLNKQSGGLSAIPPKPYNPRDLTSHLHYN